MQTLTLKHYKEESEEINMHQENLLVISIKYYLYAMLTSQYHVKTSSFTTVWIEVTTIYEMEL